MDPLDLGKNGGAQDNSYHHPHHQQPGYPSLVYPVTHQIQHNQPDRSNKFYDPFFMQQDNTEINSNVSVSSVNGSREGVESVIQHHRFENEHVKNQELNKKDIFSVPLTPPRQSYLEDRIQPDNPAKENSSSNQEFDPLKSNNHEGENEGEELLSEDDRHETGKGKKGLRENEGSALLDSNELDKNRGTSELTKRESVIRPINNGVQKDNHNELDDSYLIPEQSKGEKMTNENCSDLQDKEILEPDEKDDSKDVSKIESDQDQEGHIKEEYDDQENTSKHDIKGGNNEDKSDTKEEEDLDQSKNDTKDTDIVTVDSSSKRKTRPEPSPITDPKVLKEMRKWARFNQELEDLRTEQVKEEVETQIIKEEVLEMDEEEPYLEPDLYIKSNGKTKPENEYFNDMLPSMVGLDFNEYSTNQRTKRARSVKSERKVKQEESDEDFDYDSALIQVSEGIIKKRGKRKARDPLLPKIKKQQKIKVKKEFDATKLNCEECDKKFKSNLIYRQHMKRVHARIPIKCDICSKDCPDPGKLMEHKMRIHTEHVEREQGPLQRFSCDICPEGTSPAYVVARDLAKHMHIKHSGKPKKPPPEENCHFCDLCGKGYKKKWPLVLHMRRHSGEKPYTCDRCAKAFFLKGDLKRHYDINHVQQVEQYICNTCGKTYTNIHNFRVHERGHIKKENIKCQKCQEVFPDKSSLREHSYYHGDPQFHCKFCKADIRTPKLMSEHLSREHGFSPFSCEICCQECLTREEKKLHKIHFHQDKGFQCKICLKEFMTERHMLTHMRRHTMERKYRCDECPKAFASNVALTAHISTVHRGEKNFQCDICDKSFGRYNNLHSHKLTHSGVKPFQCVYCSSGYAEKRNLMNHITRNHPGQPLDFKREAVKTEDTKSFPLAPYDLDRR